MAQATMPEMTHQGMALKIERIQARVRQGQIAHEVGCSRQLVTKWEGLPELPPKVIRDYRIALLKCAVITEEVA